MTWLVHRDMPVLVKRPIWSARLTKAESQPRHPPPPFHEPSLSNILWSLLKGRYTLEPDGLFVACVPTQSTNKDVVNHICHTARIAMPNLAVRLACLESGTSNPGLWILQSSGINYLHFWCQSHRDQQLSWSQLSVPVIVLKSTKIMNHMGPLVDCRVKFGTKHVFLLRFTHFGRGIHCNKRYETKVCFKHSNILHSSTEVTITPKDYRNYCCPFETNSITTLTSSSPSVSPTTDLWIVMSFHLRKLHYVHSVLDVLTSWMTLKRK